MTVNPNPYPGACLRVILTSFKPGSSGMSRPAGRGMRFVSVSTKGIKDRSPGVHQPLESRKRQSLLGV